MTASGRARDALWRAGWHARDWWRAAALDRAYVASAASTPSRHPQVRALAALRTARARAADADAPRWTLAELRVVLDAGAYDRAAALAASLEPRLVELPARARHDARRWIAETRRARGEAPAPAPNAPLAPAAGLRAWLRDPERRLAGAPATTAALTAYLADYGLPGAEVVPGEAPWLARVRFEPPPPVRGPRVSVLVAAHRAAATIDYALASLRGQSYQDVELLVGDDASDDDTVARALAHARVDPRVRVFTSARNQGAYNVRNALAARARGDLLAFHDADDLALPTRLAAQVARVRAGAAASYGCFVRLTTDGQLARFPGASLRLCMVSLMLPRRTFDQLGGFRPARFGADLELRERLRDRHGDDAIDVLRAPVMLALWSESSQTRAAGAESGADGFRAPARRAYTEVVFRALCGEASDDDIVAALRATDNLATPADVTEVTS